MHQAGTETKQSTPGEKLQTFCSLNLVARLLCAYFGTRSRKRPVAISTLEGELDTACREQGSRPPKHSDVVRALKTISEFTDNDSHVFGRYIEGRHGKKSRFEFTEALISFGQTLQIKDISFGKEATNEAAEADEDDLPIEIDTRVQTTPTEFTYAELIDDNDDGAELTVDDRPVSSQPNDWNVETLRNKLERGMIDLQPHYQREFVWAHKPELTSRLIESLLLEIPIPPIYFGKQASGKLEVIDGQQRLTTLISFVRNEFPLSKLQRMSSLNTKKFKDLDEAVQSKILDTSIRSIVIDTGANESLKYEIFERFNRGSVALNQQELRNCVYRGLFNNMLGELVEDPTWRKIVGTANPEPRFIEREMLLRFFALSNRLDYYSGNLKQFLNTYMDKHAPKNAEDIAILKSQFRQTMQNVDAVFGPKAARIYGISGDSEENTSGGWNQKFSISALDIQASALIGQPRESVQAASDQIREAYIDFLLTNDNIRAAIAGHTASTKATKLRWVAFKSRVVEIIAKVKTEPRFFSYEFRKELYDKDPACKLCSNPIYSFEDATVDHILAYVNGGQTRPENGQLAHRWCNSKKHKNLEINLTTG